MKRLDKIISFGFIAITMIYSGSPLLVYAVGETTETTSNSGLLESSELQRAPSLSTEQSKEAVITNTIDSTVEQSETNTEEVYSEESTPLNAVEMVPINRTQMKLTISNPNGGNVTRVQFPTWSNTNGQDDLQWLQGTRNTDGSYSVVVNADEYKHDGLFVTDIYGTVDGKMEKLGETNNYYLEKSPVNIITIMPISKTQIKLIISNPNGGNVTRVQFPTWSSTNGQDDLQWLQGTRNTDGSYSVVVNADEYKHGGLFITDIYGTVDGKMQKLGETTTYNLEKSPVNIITTTPIGKTQMKLTISNPNGGNVTRVQFPTWSSINGQDDLQWLQGTRNADGSYSVVVNADEYKHDGLFVTDIYGTVDGKMQKLGQTTTYNLEKSPANIITTTAIGKTKMKVTISNPNGGNVTRVQFPTWSNTNGQDDIQWLQGTRNSDGSYSVVVNADEYKHDGLFVTDIYGTVDGKMQKLGNTVNYTLEKTPNVVTTSSISKTKMKITISNPNGGNVTRVQFPTWSNTNGQDDIQWLQGTRNSDASYSVEVDSANFKHDGLFITDIYGTVNGQLQKLSGISYTLEKIYATHLLVMGHGGTDPGALGSGTNEREFTRNELLPVLKKYATQLKSSTIIFYDPNRDMYQDSRLMNGAYKVSSNMASVTEVHLDSGPSYSSGGHVIISPNAKNIQNINISSIIKKYVGWNAGYAYNQGLSERTDLLNLNVFRQRNIPYRLTELGFISNPNDVMTIRKNKNQLCKELIEQITGENIN